MLLDHWYRLIETVAIPAWLPRWSLVLALPVAVLVAYAIVSRLVPLLVPRSRREPVSVVLQHTRLPVQLILLTTLLGGIVEYFVTDPGTIALVAHGIPVTMVVLVSILAYRINGTVFIALRNRFDISGTDNLKARRVTTQIVVLERVVGFLIVVIALSVGLMTIPEVQRWGTSILASAGVVGLLVGFAAQQTIANVLAGIQIAITQPLRIEDAVVIDGEWGWVEEITLTYVVVRIWDKRRLVVPISHLLRTPFQNWTRNNSSIIGSVQIYADYTVDVDALRIEQSRFLAARDLWDGEVDVIQVTDTTERTVLLRSLVSARNAPDAWDLRCLLREHLVATLREKQPQALPRERMRIHGIVAPRGFGDDGGSAAGTATAPGTPDGDPSARPRLRNTEGA
ncbi:MAG: mechanosensitive ion channel family protein [Alkalispirochaeta sp.]